MRKVEFTKMVASGNDFIIIRKSGSLPVSLKDFSRETCDRKYGIGADGLLVMEKSKVADAKMRIFNADGSEAEMCGNGARCFSLWMSLKTKIKNLKLETKAGIINTEVKDENVKINLTGPKDLELGIPIFISGRRLTVDFVNTGVPHAVVFVEGLEKIDVVGLGRQIRYHKQFSPAGANVNFVEVLDKNSIKIRTYERGVEGETLACGTGSVASSLVASCKLQGVSCDRINVHTRGGEVLKVYFNREADNFSDVWLEGSARKVYKGEYYV